MTIKYDLEPDLQAEEFQILLQASGLASRRPANDLHRLERMLRGAQLIVTARSDGFLCGATRSITDWVYCLYCSDLCVDCAWQGRGIGRTLLSITAASAPDVKACILLAAPDARSFYEAAECEPHPGAFLFNRNVEGQ